MAKKRKTMGNRTRFDIFRRDLFTCQYCGAKPPAVVLQIDHIVAVANGGEDGAENLITSCFECNSGKSDKDLSTPIPSRQESIARARELQEQTTAYNAFLMETRAVTGAQIRRLGIYWCNHFGTADQIGRFVLNNDNAASVRQFLRELTQAEVLEAMDIGIARFGDEPLRAFRYFAGVCWKKIAQRRSE